MELMLRSALTSPVRKSTPHGLHCDWDLILPLSLSLSLLQMFKRIKRISPWLNNPERSRGRAIRIPCAFPPSQLQRPSFRITWEILNPDDPSLCGFDPVGCRVSVPQRSVEPFRCVRFHLTPPHFITHSLNVNPSRTKSLAA